MLGIWRDSEYNSKILQLSLLFAQKRYFFKTFFYDQKTIILSPSISENKVAK